MNITLHLTEQCNMNCSYCVHDKKELHMSEKVMLASCDYIFKSGKSAGICFFGGEPLLKKDLIYKAVERCKILSKEKNMPFSCKMTTNGTLLDKEFLEYAKKIEMLIGLSFDGCGQDICRKYTNGNGTFKDVEEKSKLLLEYIPNSYAMMTIAPQAVHTYSESVEYLYNLGFHNITATPAYGKRVNWTDEKLEELKSELKKTADFYKKCFENNKHIYFGTFDSKISDAISGINSGARCHLGLRQMPVTYDGSLYPCTQFIGDPEYKLGDVFNGLDNEKVKKLIQKSSMPDECINCDLKNRCTNSCGCMNRLETGNENHVSPMQCAYEQILINIVDELAEHLIKVDEKRFLKKFANK